MTIQQRNIFEIKLLETNKNIGTTRNIFEIKLTF